MIEFVNTILYCRKQFYIMYHFQGSGTDSLIFKLARP